MDAQQPKKQQDDKLEGLPVKDSPYTQYKDLEDYKQQGYTNRWRLAVERRLLPTLLLLSLVVRLLSL